jgi:hypothetical protein
MQLYIPGDRTPKMGAIGSSETSVYFHRNTRLYITEEGIFRRNTHGYLNVYLDKIFTQSLGSAVFNTQFYIRIF